MCSASDRFTLMMLLAFAGAAPGAMAAAPSAAAARDHTDTIYDFLVMKVCTAKDGSVTSEDPLHCPAGRQRNLRPGEAVRYFHADWSPPGSHIACGEAGISRRYAFPLPFEGSDQSGARFPLIVGWTDYPPDRKSCTFNVPNPRDTMSLLTVQGGWGANLGSRSPSGYVATLGSGYLDPGTDGVARFNKTWAFPEHLPAPGRIDYDIFPKHTQVLGHDVAAIGAFPAHDPATKLSQTIEFWTRLSFTYGTAGHPGATLDTLFEVGTPKSLPTGDGPGESRGSEHLYLTRELGYVTRWEDWHRDDQHDAIPRAQKAYALGVCTKPASMEGRVSAHFTLGPVTEDSQLHLWRQDYITVLNGATVTHTWYMGGCHDFTNVRPQAAFAPAAVVTEAELGTPFLNLFRAHHAR